MEHRIEVKVYYEDTDCLGIVYYANYLKYMERGRTEFINAGGKPIHEWNREGFNFVVFEMKIKFLKAARLGDICQVITRTMEGGSEYRRKLSQKIELDGKTYIDAEVDILCLDDNQKLKLFPAGILD